MIASPVLPACGSSTIPVMCATTAEQNTGASSLLSSLSLCISLIITTFGYFSCVTSRGDNTEQRVLKKKILKVPHLTKKILPKGRQEMGLQPCLGLLGSSSLVADPASPMLAAEF